jgi:signal transduction histidine kinase
MANVLAAAVARHAGEQTLRAAKAEADRANAAKSEFLSRMSHELRTPLNGILGFAQLAELDAETDDERENVDQIRTAGAHLLQLINEILDLSSIEAGRMALSIQPVALRRAFEAALAIVRPLAAARKIEVADPVCDGYVLADEHGCTGPADLLANAVKYNRGRWFGVAEVHADRAPAPSASRSRIQGEGSAPLICQPSSNRSSVSNRRAKTSRELALASRFHSGWCRL